MSKVPFETHQRIKMAFEARKEAFIRHTPVNDETYRLFSEYNRAQYLNELLAASRPHTDLYDAHCRFILSPEQYNSIRDKCLAEGRDMNTGGITVPVLLPDEMGERKKSVPVDAGIAHHVLEMSGQGYVTAVCCSGLLADHPNDRYIEESTNGLYHKGEPLCWNQKGSVAYIGFYKADNRHPERAANSPEQIEDIRKAAEESGWLHEDTRIFGRPAVVLRLPVTLDGAGSHELFAEGRKLVEQAQPGLFASNFMAAVELRDTFMPAVYANHGGVVQYTDRMLKERWLGLTMRLGMAYYQRRQAEAVRGNVPQMTLVKGPVTAPQLEDLLGRCGISLNRHALDRHVPNSSGVYMNLWFELRAGEAVQTPAGFDAADDVSYRYTDFNKMLADRLMSDIKVDEKNGVPFVTCRIDGVQQPDKTLSKGCVSAYAMGKLDDRALALMHFTREMYAVGDWRKQEVKDGYGYRTTNGHQTVYHGEWNGTGTVYKDYEAFREKKGICYISDNSLQQYHDDLKEGRNVDIADYGDDYGSIMALVREYRFDNPEKVAEQVLYSVEWEGIDTRLAEWEEEEEEEVEEEQAVEGVSENEGQELGDWTPSHIVFMDRRVDYATMQFVLGQQGLHVPAADRTDIPLDKDGCVAADYLGFSKGKYLHWTDEYDFRDSPEAVQEIDIIPFKVLHDRERVSDITYYKDQQDRWMFRCKVDGEQWLGQPVPEKFVRKGEDGPVLLCGTDMDQRILQHLADDLDKAWDMAAGRQQSAGRGR